MTWSLLIFHTWRSTLPHGNSVPSVRRLDLFKDLVSRPQNCSVAPVGTNQVLFSLVIEALAELLQKQPAAVHQVIRAIAPSRRPTLFCLFCTTILMCLNSSVTDSVSRRRRCPGWRRPQRRSVFVLPAQSPCCTILTPFLYYTCILCHVHAAVDTHHFRRGVIGLEESNSACSPLTPSLFGLGS